MGGGSSGGPWCMPVQGIPSWRAGLTAEGLGPLGDCTVQSWASSQQRGAGPNSEPGGLTGLKLWENIAKTTPITNPQRLINVGVNAAVSGANIDYGYMDIRVSAGLS